MAGLERQPDSGGARSRAVSAEVKGERVSDAGATVTLHISVHVMPTMPADAAERSSDLTFPERTEALKP